MGGLVARAAANSELGKTDGNVAEKILGVIHGVMPTHGAAAAYRRCHAGFEGSSVGRGFNPAARILGKNGPEVAAIFSNSPGALELLPNKLYGPGWLKIANPDGTEKVLPESDPYKEIYEQKDVWWRLMNPEWVDPSPGLSSQERDDAWERFLKTLDKASSFHERLGASHHEHTCVQYSADSDEHKAFGSLTWKQNNRYPGPVSDPPTCAKFTERDSGEVTLRRDIDLRHVTIDRKIVHDQRVEIAEFAFLDQDQPGDGTVPICSAQALNETIEIAAAHSPGYDHQGSYGDRRAKELTAYAVVRFVSEYMP